MQPRHEFEKPESKFLPAAALAACMCGARGREMIVTYYKYYKYSLYSRGIKALLRNR